MYIDNRLDKSFGRTGTFAGYILILAGFITIFQVFGILLIAVGAFMAFSYSGVIIDTEQKSIDIYSKIFGIIKTGSRKELSSFEYIKVKQHCRNSKTYSRGNRVLDLKETDYRVFLVNPSKRDWIAVKKCDGPEKANEEANKLSSIINIPILSKG